ncbi:MAG: branched-chain amino acid ABC transporter permease [Actinomycetota bacterium]|nr:branched-chain amino acid ABC transporter permease [Actinomycetota bacterium]
MSSVLAPVAPAQSAAGARFPDRVGRAVQPYRTALAAAGFLLVLVGVNLPWATYTGFPGLMTLALYPGGAKAYCLILATAFLLFVIPWDGRRRAAGAALLGLAATAGLTIAAIGIEGGGLVNVTFGAWLTLAGGLLGAVAATALPPDAPPRPWRRLSPPVEWLLIAAAYTATLLAVVFALRTEDSAQFLAFLLAAGSLLLALSRLGILAGFGALTELHRGVAMALALAMFLMFPFTQGGSEYWLRVAASVGVFAAAAIGLNIVVGLAGLLDLGYIAFFGCGAYVAALLSGASNSTVALDLPFGVVLIVGAVVAAVLGVLIGAPTLRLSGDYLAIVTLGFGEIFRIAMTNNIGGISNGPNGIFGIPNLSVAGVDLGQTQDFLGVALPSFANYYYLELLLVLAVMLIFSRLDNSRIGRAWVAIREDEVAAAAMGINTINLKLLAFALGALLAGAAGTVSAHLSTQVSPDSFTFMQSVLLVAAVVLGGMGTIPGAIIGSALLIAIPEKLRSFEDYRLLLFGLALVLMMRFRPEGMVANRRRQREFHDPASGGDAMGAAPGATGALP